MMDEVPEAMRASESLFRALVENGSDLVWMTDAEGRITYASPSVVRVLGHALPGMVGAGFRHFVAPDDLPSAVDAFRQALARPGQAVPWEGRLRHAEGGFRVVAALATNHLDTADVRGIVINGRDVSEQKRAENALRESDVQFRAVFDGALDAMVVTDDEGRFLEANPAACQLYGLPRAELLDRRVAEFAAPGFHFGQVLEAVRKTGRFRAVHPVFRPDGTIREVEASTTGNVVPGRHFSSLRDLTEQRQLEGQLRQAQKMEAVGRLAGGIAHDFNNILAVITGYGDMLQREISPQDPRTRRVEQIRRSADRAASLVRQLLAFSRRQVLQPRVLELAESLRELAPMLRRLIGEDIELLTASAPDLGHVKADPGQIEQVIMNLAVNARDAMPRGGKLQIELRNADLDEGWARTHAGGRAGRYVLLALSDTGVGMDAETLKHVFEPFFTTKELGKGTGLGLAMVYGIVKQSDGHVWVYSEPGVGTTVKVYLPRVDEEVEHVAARPEAAPSRGGETILLAEDEESLAEMIKEILEERGYTVLAPGAGPQALETAQTHKGSIHLVVTDVVMPRLSGRELVGRLSEVHPETKVLYMSGYTDDAIAHHGVLDAGVPFIEKPFSPEALASKVREVLDT
jgi:two-component system cell cycle sensor histidine kinase/response regulator CckA